MPAKPVLFSISLAVWRDEKATFIPMLLHFYTGSLSTCEFGDPNVLMVNGPG